MTAIPETVTRLLRGSRVSSRVLTGLGIDATRYWLLMDLFGELSERGEMLDQLGANGVALQMVTRMYAAISALIVVLLLAAGTALATYFATFLILTAFLLLTVLLSEAGNSLVNPTEGLVLAHQPIDAATYTAAKLTHLARIVVHLALGINALPALAGLMLKDSRWSYPLVHLLAALGAGLLAGLLCCAMYGWLIRLMPARRLRAAAQLAATAPLLAMMWWQPLHELWARYNLLHWLPAQPAARWALGGGLGTAAAAMVVLGIRSLSADYLIRVSGMTRSGAAAGSGARKSWIGAVVARLFGGQPARAGYVFLSRMARRDFQFRRQLAPMLVSVLLGLVPLVAVGWRTDPFSRHFTPAHLLPHLFGGLLFFICSFLPYGNDFKGVWIFLLAPAEAFGGFARGIHAALFAQVIVIPHAIMLALFAWPWGMWRAALFTGYSAAIASVYLAVELRLIDGVPFSRQADPRRGATLLPLMSAAGLAMAIAVGLQYFFVFRSPAMVAAVTVVAGAAAYLLTRFSLGALEGAMRYSLGLLSAESGALYKEIDL